MKNSFPKDGERIYAVQDSGSLDLRHCVNSDDIFFIEINQNPQTCKGLPVQVKNLWYLYSYLFVQTFNRLIHSVNSKDAYMNRTQVLHPEP